jgi:uncharacterized membrane protein
MPDEPPAFDPQKLWQSQTTEHAPMTLAQIHQKARTFQARIRRRNIIEYVGCVLVIAGFAPALLHRGSWMMQAGAVWLMAAAVFIAWQLNRRASARTAPDAGEAVIEFHRRELIRQRDALRSVGVWYLAPAVPGMALLLAGRWFQSHATKAPLALDHAIIALVGLIAVLVFAVIWLLNQRGADRLQRQIEDL